MLPLLFPEPDTLEVMDMPDPRIQADAVLLKSKRPGIRRTDFDLLDLRGRKTVVTGGANGLGKAIARAFQFNVIKYLTAPEFDASMLMVIPIAGPIKNRMTATAFGRSQPRLGQGGST